VLFRSLKEQFHCEYPDIVMACVGGGSNAMGMFYHFLDDQRIRILGVEAAGEGVASGRSAATTALGTPGVLHGSKTLLMQTADGQVEEAHSISAGLDYPGIGPQHAHLCYAKRVEYVNVTDAESLAAASELTKLEGILPALESAHALAYLPKLQGRADKTIVVCLSGRGDKDMKTYMERL
jgi:tryptophan synthase beta chain